MNKGPKIKELARELGVTSRMLIERCRDEGLDVQNSVTRLTPAQAQQARGWFRPVRLKAEHKRG
ncbi:MAG: hypothetical protein C4547_08805 [Phycisphaerales bacterium]|nr:MAG: hypothetical protein C4547_08805 [Phycisphaerales bacterium]